jgi:putative hydrolase of the HAD superfamily
MKEQTLLMRIRDLTEPLSPSPPGHELKLQQLNSIECVAFDFYGTMFISGVGDIGIDEEQETENDALFRDALKDTGFTILNPAAGILGIEIFEKTISEHIARREKEGVDYPEPDIIDVWLEVLDRLSKENLISGGANKEKAIRFAIEFEFRVNKVWPVPDLAYVLNQLSEQNFTLGIISNSQFYTPMAFEALLGKSPERFGFDHELLNWSYASGLKKPSIHFYRLFMDALKENKGLGPEKVLYVGNDVEKDIKPAKKLGMKTALFVGDARSVRHDHEDLQDPLCQPDLIVDDLSQIIECLATIEHG